MKVINIMNFVRRCDPRIEDSEDILYETTRRELELVRELRLPSTFLLQYDALTDRRYQELFSGAGQDLELGLWLEIVRPLTDAVGLHWRGREGWAWDWHVVPGFSMAYTPADRRRIVDECMNRFREVFGVYPRTVGSWLLDTVTASYLLEKYHISALAICRDQTNTDAYTLIGGYFNQAYYPSKKNIFTPAQSSEMQLNVPVFRLLGPDPVHNYDNERYLHGPGSRKYRDGEVPRGCYTIEPVWGVGSDPEVMDWFFRTYFVNEDLGFSYMQLGQENSFGTEDFLPALRLQLEKACRLPGVVFRTMGDTGEAFRRLYPGLTPATCVCALDDWNRGDEVQSVYYDCKNYTANIFREGGRIFIRSLYRFDENVPERYLDTPCETWDATYENISVIDTLRGEGAGGLTLAQGKGPFAVSRSGECLTVSWEGGSATFAPDKVTSTVPGLEYIYSSNRLRSFPHPSVTKR